MRAITIEIDDGNNFDVVDEQGRRCNGLAWDEMLGQVAVLTIPIGRVGKGYQMQTAEEWAADRAHRFTTTTED